MRKVQKNIHIVLIEKKRISHLKKIVYGVTEQPLESKIITLFITTSVVLQTKFSQISLTNNSSETSNLTNISFLTEKVSELMVELQSIKSSASGDNESKYNYTYYTIVSIIKNLILFKVLNSKLYYHYLITQHTPFTICIF